MARRNNTGRNLLVAGVLALIAWNVFKKPTPEPPLPRDNGGEVDPGPGGEVDPGLTIGYAHLGQSPHEYQSFAELSTIY